MGRPVVILGASGYSGAELLRLLGHHPLFEIFATSADRSLGRALDEVQPHLAGTGWPDPVSAAAALEAGGDLIFSCLPSGALDRYLPAVGERPVVDLSDAYRSDGTWRYGLTEFARDEALGRRVANPGCYPTAALLALLPFARADAIEGPIVIDALSGVSGAGRSLADHLLFATIDGASMAYGDIPHRHVAEIERSLELLGGLATRVSFTPHLVPMSRGVLVTARAALRNDLDDGEALEILHESYLEEPFVHVLATWPSTKAVLGSNRALVTARVDHRTGMLVCNCAIDNLGKGAAGQALQNANLISGVEETLGLEMIGMWP